MNNSEFDDAYEDKARIRGAIFTTNISELKLRKPIRRRGGDRGCRRSGDERAPHRLRAGAEGASWWGCLQSET